jgi:hypothetical protein
VDQLDMPTESIIFNVHISVYVNNNPLFLCFFHHLVSFFLAEGHVCCLSCPVKPAIKKTAAQPSWSEQLFALLVFVSSSYSWSVIRITVERLSPPVQDLTGLRPGIFPSPTVLELIERIFNRPSAP